MAKRLPWVMVSADPTETARYLIQHAGGVQAARDAISRAAKQQQHGHRKPIVDTHWLLVADAIQRRDKCSDNMALKGVANLAVIDEGTKASMVRRLRRRLGGRSLAASIPDGLGRLSLGQ